jgi:uncharacterized membrane protein
MKPSQFFNKEQEQQILQAIASAEKNTSGEIRVHLEARCKGDTLDRAAFLFAKLEMQKTKLRNGVLFYLAVNDKKFAIIGDAGINSTVPGNFWEDIKDTMQQHFLNSKFSEGLSKGIQMAGEQLKKHFPYQDDDINELSDEISYGKE